MKTLFLLLLPFLMAFAPATPPRLKPGQVYMGAIKNQQGRVVYHVVKYSDTREQGLLRAHRIDEVVFLNAAGQQVGGYDVGADNLPVAVKRNALYFHYQNDNGQTVWHRVLINPAVPLPAMLCVAARGGCYRQY